MDIKLIIDEIILNYFPNPPASELEIVAFETKSAWQLDNDLRSFYTRCNGASLFRKFDSTYRLLPLSEVVKARNAVFGQDDDIHGPASWYVICDNGDGDYVAIDVESSYAGGYCLFDVDHGTFPDLTYARPVAKSFGEFLERALQGGNRRYWLESESGTTSR